MQESKKTNKKVFLKYCGGCNPHYNRRKYGESLIQMLGAQRTKNLAEADYIIVLDGCACQCISAEGKMISVFKSGKLRPLEELVQKIQKEELS